jgi:hypothetical protein
VAAGGEAVEQRIDDPRVVVDDVERWVEVVDGDLAGGVDGRAEHSGATVVFRSLLLP